MFISYQLVIIIITNTLQVKDLIFTGVDHTKTLLKEVKDQVFTTDTYSELL